LIYCGYFFVVKMSVFPIEILENIARFADPKTLYNLSLVEPEIRRIVEERGLWLVKFPPVIDWTSPNAPKDYKEYDKADFTIEFRGNIYKRSDNYWFAFSRKNSEVTRQDRKFTLNLNDMVITTTYKKCLTLGKSQEDIDREFVLTTLQWWPSTRSYPIRFPIVTGRLYDDHERTDDYLLYRKQSRKKPEKIYYDEDGDFTLI
jgi:hypothetical protein